MRFQGKAVFVTGGALGLGEASVRRFASDDAKWVIGHTIPVDGGYVAK